MKAIIVTGGHHNSALVVAKELVSKGYRVIWLGHRYAAKGDKNDSAEYVEVKASGIPFHELKAGKMESSPTFGGIFNIPLGFVRAFKYLIEFKPSAVLSFGGYLGLAVAVPAYFLRIPVYLHEQTLVAGKANAHSAKFAKRIYLAWQESIKYFPKFKTQFVGLPLRPGILSSKPVKQFNNKLSTILILGGKQGSHTINQQVFASLPSLLTKYNVIHQTGTSSVTNDFETAKSRKETLPSDLSERYLPIGYIGEDKIGAYFASVDLVVSRSGAHTAYELAFLGKRCVLIPFMHTTGSEQYQQAKLLEKAGLAVILTESNLSAPTLIKAITDAINIDDVSPVALPRDASNRMVDDLIADLG